jgi:hypothetical protein
MKGEEVARRDLGNRARGSFDHGYREGLTQPPTRTIVTRKSARDATVSRKIDPTTPGERAGARTGWVRPGAGSGFDPGGKWLALKIGGDTTATMQARPRPFSWVRVSSKAMTIRFGAGPRKWLRFGASPGRWLRFRPPLGSIPPESGFVSAHRLRSPGPCPGRIDATRPASVPRQYRGNRGALDTLPRTASPSRILIGAIV